MKTPARLRWGGTPHEENIASRRATSLGGGAMIEVRIAARSFRVACTSETPGR